MKVTKILEKLSACSEGVDYIADQSAVDAWNNCKRGDWMLWIASRRGVDIRILTKAKVECAKLVEHLMTDERSINALRVAEKFANGEATNEELVAAYAAAAAAAAAAAYAAYAADAAYAAAAAAAADAADAAADAAAYATRLETLKKCADICRQTIDFDLLDIN